MTRHVTDNGNHDLRQRRFLPYLFESLAREVTLTVLSPKAGEKVLQIGVETGETLLHLATLVGHDGAAIGTEDSEQAIALSRRRLEEAGLTAELHRAGPQSLPFDNGAMDAVYCAYAFDALGSNEALAALREIRRVLKPGGRAAFCGLTPGERPLARAVAATWTVLARVVPKMTSGRLPRRLTERMADVDMEIDRRLYLEQRGLASEVLLVRRPRGLGLAH